MTPGFAKPRSELPWLPYSESDRVIINAHNFTPIFSPSSITGLLAWHDWSDASTQYDATSGGSLVAADGAVARLEDKSGNGWHLINATAGHRPLRKTAIQNGLDCGLFDGTDDVLRSSSNFTETGDANFSVFIAAKKLTSSKGFLFGWGEVATTLGATGYYDDGSLQMIAFAGSNNFFTSAVDSSFNLFSFLKSAGAINTTTVTRINRASFATSGHSSNTPNIVSEKLRIGQWSNYASGFYHGYYGEILIYDSKLTDVDRDDVEAYLKTKWGTP